MRKGSLQSYGHSSSQTNEADIHILIKEKKTRAQWLIQVEET